MNQADYNDIEKTLFSYGDLSSRELKLSDQEAAELIANSHYQRSLGFPYTATQYRRANPDGSCFHLVWRDGVPHIHRDTYDPHESPMSLYMHLSNEARSEYATTCALAWSVIKTLAR